MKNILLAGMTILLAGLWDASNKEGQPAIDRAMIEQYLAGKKLTATDHLAPMQKRHKS